MQQTFPTAWECESQASGQLFPSNRECKSQAVGNTVAVVCGYDHTITTILTAGCLFVYPVILRPRLADTLSILAITFPYGNSC